MTLIFMTSTSIKSPKKQQLKLSPLNTHWNPHRPIVPHTHIMRLNSYDSDKPMPSTSEFHQQNPLKVEIFHAYFICFAPILNVCFYSVNVYQSICSICSSFFLFIFVINLYIHDIKWVSKTEAPVYNSAK